MNIKFEVYLLLFIWLILTVIAVCTIIGVILIVADDKKYTTWQEIGIKLTEKL